MRGRIIKIIAGFYDVEINKTIYRVRGSGKLRQQNNLPVVGDYVEFQPNHFINKVLPRNNSLIRPKVANIDQVIIVMSLKQPDFSSYLLDKYLALVEFRNIKPIIILTKIDLVKNHQVKADYTSQGYEVFEVNNLNFKNIDLTKLFKNKVSVLMGQSGAGKSSFLNNLAELNLATQEISKALNRGKHTTRTVEMFDFKDGKIIDTPGFSSITFDLTKKQMAQSYHDFKLLSKQCKFYKNCLHFHEELCGIKSAVKQGKILNSRYLNYLKILGEIELPKQFK